MNIHDKLFTQVTVTVFSSHCIPVYFICYVHLYVCQPLTRLQAICSKRIQLLCEGLKGSFYIPSAVTFYNNPLQSSPPTVSVSQATHNHSSSLIHILTVQFTVPWYHQDWYAVSFATVFITFMLYCVFYFFILSSSVYIAVQILQRAVLGYYTIKYFNYTLSLLLSCVYFICCYMLIPLQCNAT